MVFYCCSICYITLYTNTDTETQKLAKETAKRVRLFWEEIEKMYRNRQTGGGDDISEQVLKSENPWSILQALLYLYF